MGASPALVPKPTRMSRKAVDASVGERCDAAPASTGSRSRMSCRAMPLRMVEQEQSEKREQAAGDGEHDVLPGGLERFVGAIEVHERS